MTALRALLAACLVPILVGSALAGPMPCAKDSASWGCPCADAAHEGTPQPAIARACCCEAEDRDSLPAPLLPSRVEQSSSATAVVSAPVRLLGLPQERFAARRVRPVHRSDTRPPILLLKQSFLI